MKKYLKLVLIFFIFLVLFSIRDVCAKNVKLDLDATKLKGGPYTYTKGNKKFGSAQSMAITNKYIVIMFLDTIDSTNNDYSNLIVAYDKKTFKEVKKVTILNDTQNCGHANGLTYNSKSNVLVCADNARRRFVVYDAETFKYIKNVKYPKGSDGEYLNYSNVAYDSIDNAYWAARTRPSSINGDGIDKFDINLNKIDEIRNSELVTYYNNDVKYRINQESCYYRGRLYLINFTGNDDSKVGQYKTPFPSAGYNDMIIFSYDLKNYTKDLKTTSRIFNKGNILYNQKSKGITNGDSYREVESLEFDGNKAYLLFQRGGAFQVYTTKPVKNNINATVTAKVNTNNEESFKKLNMNSTFKSTSSNISINKTINYNNNYSLKGLSIDKYGTYNINIKQKSINDSRWKMDNSTIESQVKVFYNIDTNNTSYVVSYKNAKNTFENTFTYDPIQVPISVSANLTKIDAGATLPSLNASLASISNNKRTVVSSTSMSSSRYKFANLSIKQPGTYTYEIKQANAGKIVNGVYTYDIDSSVINVTIKVKADGDKLVYSIAYSKSGFNNKVSVNYNRCSYSGTIEIESIKNDDFDTPSTYMDVYKNSNKITSIANNGKYYNYNFIFDKPGVYTYEFKQDRSVPGRGNISYELDQKIIVFTVKAYIKNNILVIEPKISSNSYKNKYTINYNAVNVPISVRIDSINNTSGSVPITKAVISGNGIKETIDSLDGYYKYNLSFKNTGTYTYTIKQNNISMDNIDCDIDNSKIVVTVNITKSNGVLVSNVSYSTNHYVNNYTENVDPINLSFSVNIKTELEDDSLDVPVTKAKLYDSNNNEIKTVSSSKNKYSFGSIRIEEAGTYTYKIKQDLTVNSLNPSINYVLDEKEIIVTANIVPDGNGSLKANTSYSSGYFSNKVNINYIPIDTNISYDINNNISSDAVKNVDLSATIYSGSDTIKIVNENNNKYSFSLQFNKPGNYTYTIKQNDSGIRKRELYTASIDNDTKTFIVHVTSNNGVLNSSVEYKYNDKSFENDFIKTSEVLKVPISVGINTTKLDEKAKAPITKAIISEKNDNDEYDNLETVNSNNGTYTFNNIEVVAEGYYTYKVSQLNSGNYKDSIYTYSIDSEEKLIQVVVYENSEGRLTYRIDSDDSPFENSVGIDYDPITIPISVNINTKNTDNLEYTAPKVIISDSVQVIEEKDANTANVTFSNVTVKKPGTYTYKIYQRKPYTYNSSSVEYDVDEKVINVEVTVTADSNNNLISTIKYNNSSDIQTFNNEYKTTASSDTSFVDTSVKVDIFSNNSNVKTIKTKATLFEDDIPIDTVENDNGSYEFNVKLISGDGNHNYTIRQVPYEDNEWSLDDTEISVELEPYTDDNGIQYRVNYSNNVSSFTNLDGTVLRMEDEEDNDFVIYDVPNTGLKTSDISLIIGLLLVLVGGIILSKNLENYKRG